MPIRAIDAVGWQAHDPQGHEQPNLVLNNLVNAVRATGQLGIIGVYVPEDPGGSDELVKQGQVPFDIGLYFMKELRMGSGQANVKDYNRQLRDLIAAGKAHPGFYVSHNLGLDDAPEAYRHFDNRERGWTKVVLNPTKG